MENETGYAELVGSISWGTLRNQDLLPAFLEELAKHDPRAAANFNSEVPTAAKEHHPSRTQGVKAYEKQGPTQPGTK